MDLNRRLQTLRREAGGMATDNLPDTAPAGDGDALSTRLARLQHARRHGRGRSATRQPPVDDQELARRTGGRILAAGLLLIERQHPLSHPPHEISVLPHPALPEAAKLHANEWVCIDTETTGLAGGSGTLAFLLGMARVQGEKLVVRQYLISRFAGERAMLEQALDWLGPDTGLISYNGKSFDLPLLKTRSRLAGVAPEAWERPHLDLLHGVRRCFDGRWPDCRLATVEGRLLGITRQHDLPGSEAPAAWLAHLQQGDAGRLPAVLDHNRQDLVTLLSLHDTLARVHESPQDWAADSGRIARAWLRQDEPQRARRLLEDALDDLVPADQNLLARLRLRDGAVTAACELLESLAENGDTEASERLAKYHEHKTRDLRRAAAFARRLPDGPQKARRLGRIAAKDGLNHELPFG